MKIVSPFFSLLSLLTLCGSCSDESRLASEGTPVRFSLSGIGAEASGNTASTRGAALDKDVTVRVVAYRGTAYVADNTYTADGSGNLTSTTEMRLIEDTYDFYAVTPALAIASKGTGGPTFTVGQGVDFAAVKKSSTKVTAYSGSSSSSKQIIALGELARQCAKLTFAVDLSGDVSSGVARTDITDASLTSMPTSLTATGITLPGGSGSGTLTVGADAFVTDSKEPRKASGSTIALPKVSGMFNLNMKARFNGVTSLVTSFPATGVPSMSFEGSKEYTFTVRLTKDKLGNSTVGLWLTVSRWSTSDQGYGVGGVPPSGDIYTQLLGYWTDITWEDVELGVEDGPSTSIERSIITGVSGWWTNHYYNPHVGSDDPNSND